jgi:hypothetical protein
MLNKLKLLQRRLKLQMKLKRVKTIFDKGYMKIRLGILLIVKLVKLTIRLLLQNIEKLTKL